MARLSRQEALQAEIEAHRGEFCANAVKEFDGLCAALDMVKSAGPDGADEETLFELQRRAHKLAGRGGTFGYHDLSTSARALEIEMDRIIRSTNPMTPSEMDNIGVMIDAVGAAVRSMT